MTWYKDLTVKRIDNVPNYYSHLSILLIFSHTNVVPNAFLETGR